MPNTHLRSSDDEVGCIRELKLVLKCTKRPIAHHFSRSKDIVWVFSVFFLISWESASKSCKR